MRKKKYYSLVKYVPLSFTRVKENIDVLMDLQIKVRNWLSE
jgi:hypothetical protein